MDPTLCQAGAERLGEVLARRFANPVLVLLLLAAGLSFATGDRGNAIVIVLIMAGSTALGFINEFRAERTAQQLHGQINHSAVVLREGRERSVSVKELVVGDVVRVGLGCVVPADLRVLEAQELQCDEAVLTGESVPVDKQPMPVAGDAPMAELSSCLLMGTVVSQAAAWGSSWPPVWAPNSVGSLRVFISMPHARTSSGA